MTSMGVTKDGTFEIRFNEDKTQAVATIYPPSGGGEHVSATEILEKLRSMGVTYGVREQAILDAIHQVEDTERAVGGAVVAQGAVPVNGVDAKVKYALPLEVLTKPLPKRQDYPALPDWFALDPSKLVSENQELAVIIPPQLGSAGKTLTWPIQTITPKAGKPSSLSAGNNVRCSDDGLHLYAQTDGYVCLQGEQLTVHGLKAFKTACKGSEIVCTAGAVFYEPVEQASIKTGSFLAARKLVAQTRIRVFGDMFIQDAVNCQIIVTGSLHVMGTLRDCEVTCREKVIGYTGSTIVGGMVCAFKGIEADKLGSEEYEPTELICGVDQLSPIRSREIQEEINATEVNITKITQALKPFATMNSQENIAEDRRQLVSKLQKQRRSLEAHINELHNEKRFLTISSKEKIIAEVVVKGAVQPNVWVRIHAANYQTESLMEKVCLREAANGKSIQMEQLPKAA